MKLSDLKPCAVCGGPLPPIWYVVRASMAMLNERAARGVLGLNTIFGGQALALAETMAPAADEAVMVAMDKDRDLMHEIHICQQCYLMKEVCMGELTERS